MEHKTGIHTIILFLSVFSETAKTAEYNTFSGTPVSGTQTNEAPCKALLYKYPEISRIICFVSEAASKRAWEHFNNDIQSYCRDFLSGRDVKIRKIDQSLSSECFENEELPQLLNMLSPEDVIYLETTGGFRTNSVYLTLVSQILRYRGNEIKDAVYSDFTTKDVSSVMDTFRLFDLVGGMENMVSFGNVSALRKAYKGTDPAVHNLLDQVETLQQNISLCQVHSMDKSITAVNEAMEQAEDCSDPLMRALIPAFRAKFGGNGMDTVDLISWCLDSGMIQQALTVYTELIPEYLMVSAGLLTVGAPQTIDSLWHSLGKQNNYQSHAAQILYPKFYNDCGNRTNNFANNVSRMKGLPSPYQAHCPLDQLKHILRDYLFLKNLRNITNHANENASGQQHDRKMILNTLYKHDYPNVDKPISFEDACNTMREAIQHIRAAEAEMKK